jgi:hypothetical protein
MTEINIEKIKEQVAEEFGATVELPTKWDFFVTLNGRKVVFQKAMFRVMEIYGEKVAMRQREACALWAENSVINECPLVTDERFS